jgi:signal peptidase I
MRPTLLEGDVVLVNRLAYDFKLPLTDIRLAAISDPRRGDVVTFTSPKDGVRLIKRIVALPGDVVEMRDEVLSINGKAAHYTNLSPAQEPSVPGWTLTAVRATENSEGMEHAVQFLPGISARRSFGPLVVPAESYFALGDNRDDSADSRFIGFVPRHLLIGRAHRVVVSANINGNWQPRLDRIAEAIH